MTKWLKFSRKGASLSRKNQKKYEMWWFNHYLDIDPIIYGQLSHSQRQALMSIEQAHNDYQNSKKVKAPKQPRGAMRSRRRKRRR